MEASSQRIGITDVNLNGTDTCIERDVTGHMDSNEDAPIESKPKDG